MLVEEVIITYVATYYDALKVFEDKKVYSPVPLLLPNKNMFEYKSIMKVLCSVAKNLFLKRGAKNI